MMNRKEAAKTGLRRFVRQTEQYCTVIFYLHLNSACVGTYGSLSIGTYYQYSSTYDYRTVRTCCTHHRQYLGHSNPCFDTGTWYSFSPYSTVRAVLLLLLQ